MKIGTEQVKSMSIYQSLVSCILSCWKLYVVVNMMQQKCDQRMHRFGHSSLAEAMCITDGLKESTSGVETEIYTVR